MGDSPQEYTVGGYFPDQNKAILNGIAQTLDVVPKGTVLQEGQTIRGWVNEQGKYGPYIKVAQDRAPSSSNGAGSKSDEGIIWGWATNLAVQELAHGVSHEQVVERAQQIVAQREAPKKPEAGLTSDVPQF